MFTGFFWENFEYFFISGKICMDLLHHDGCHLVRSFQEFLVFNNLLSNVKFGGGHRLSILPNQSVFVQLKPIHRKRPKKPRKTQMVANGTSTSFHQEIAFCEKVDFCQPAMLGYQIVRHKVFVRWCWCDFFVHKSFLCAFVANSGNRQTLIHSPLQPMEREYAPRWGFPWTCASLMARKYHFRNKQ